VCSKLFLWTLFDVHLLFLPVLVGKDIEKARNQDYFVATKLVILAANIVKPKLMACSRNLLALIIKIK